MARPRAADDFEMIRARLEELHLERDRTLTGRTIGSPVGGIATNGEDRNERSLLRAIVLPSLPAKAPTAPEMVRIPRSSQGDTR